MKTKITVEEVPDVDGEEAVRPGISENETTAIQHIENSANEPMPSNQLDLRTYYKNRIMQLGSAYNAIVRAISDELTESFSKHVWDDRDTEFVNTVIMEIEYAKPTQGGKRKKNTRRAKRNKRAKHSS
jgi:hypothetical protein